MSPAPPPLGDPAEFGLPRTLRAPVPLEPTRHLPTGGPAAADPFDDPARSPRPRRSRSRALVRLAMVSAVLAALVLGGSCYFALASVHLISPHPLAEAGGWLVLLAAAAVGSLAAFGLAALALLWCRPRLLAGLALTASIALPVLTVAVGATLGVGAAQQNLAADLGREPAAAADLAVDALDAWEIDTPRPVRELLEYVAAGNG